MHFYSTPVYSFLCKGVSSFIKRMHDIHTQMQKYIHIYTYTLRIQTRKHPCMWWQTLGIHRHANNTLSCQKYYGYRFPNSYFVCIDLYFENLRTRPQVLSDKFDYFGHLRIGFGCLRPKVRVTMTYTVYITIYIHIPVYNNIGCESEGNPYTEVWFGPHSATAGLDIL